MGCNLYSLKGPGSSSLRKPDNSRKPTRQGQGRAFWAGRPLPTYSCIPECLFSKEATFPR